MSDAGPPGQGDAPAAFIDRLAGWIAILGGLLALAVAMLVVVSVLGRWLSGMAWARSAAGAVGLRLGPVNGDFEMVQMATAIAVFAFLPYTQARRGNIFVDTFTGGLPARANAWLDAFWALVYAGMMGVLSACLIAGTMEHYHSGQTTMLLQIITWPAIAISTLLLMLLTCVALATAAKFVKGDA